MTAKPDSYPDGSILDRTQAILREKLGRYALEINENGWYKTAVGDVVYLEGHIEENGRRVWCGCPETDSTVGPEMRWSDTGTRIDDEDPESLYSIVDYIGMARDKLSTVYDTDALFAEQQKAEPGSKFDAGKARIDLIAPEMIFGTAEILDFGAKKYSERNWEQGMSWSRPFGALMRHMWAWWAGERLDPETGKSHLFHASCCLMFLIAYEERKTGTDDRSFRA